MSKRLKEKSTEPGSNQPAAGPIDRRSAIKATATLGLGALVLGTAQSTAQGATSPVQLSSTPLLVIEVPTGQAGNVLVVEKDFDGDPKIRVRVSAAQAPLLGVSVE